jgi:DNA-binding NtrC family response regulator
LKQWRNEAEQRKSPVSESLPIEDIITHKTLLFKEFNKKHLAFLKSIETAISLNKKEDKDSGTIRFDKIIGKSPLIANIFHTIARIADTHASILITGESGTGKELIAEAIHHHSRRDQKPFIKVNLGGISQSLFESEMFGHKRGAFTDAHYDRTGRFDMADKGSIFLDEIGEPDSGCQVKLLRVLQDQTFEILGDSKQKRVDVRIISATNRNPAEMVANGTFREDLFYRINLITIRVPSLRERVDDIPLLTRHFASQQAVQNNWNPIEISPDAISNGMDLLRQQDFSSRLRWVGHKETDLLIDIFNKLMDQLKEERLHVREQNRFLDLLIKDSHRESHPPCRYRIPGMICNHYFE